LKRARLLAKVPALSNAFTAGDLSAGHVDAFGSVYRSAKPAVRALLTEEADALVEVGRIVTAEELRQRAMARVRQLEGPADAEERLVRQKKATRLSMWIDKETLMGRINGTFDPETYRLLFGEVVNETEARFHGLTPEYCPDDPMERQQFLRAHALLGLVTGNRVSGGGGSAEVVVVHHRDGHDVEIDWGIDGILAGRARIYNITVINGDIASAPGALNIGRDNRLANRAQRRALAAVHKTCCYPSCDVRYWQTKLHHIRFWRDGGLTDLNNLVPLCAFHHAKVHTENIELKLLAGRLVRFTHPNRHTNHSTGPP
jgi:hypothetical protein